MKALDGGFSHVQNAYQSFYYLRFWFRFQPRILGPERFLKQKKTKKLVHIVVRIVWRLYKTGWIDNWIYWITHNYSVYALQLTTVHYHTCRVFTLYLHSLPVFQYRRIHSPATLQLFSEDCCSAQLLTRNWNCPCR
jgi:hypothetical protein